MAIGEDAKRGRGQGAGQREAVQILRWLKRRARTSLPRSTATWSRRRVRRAHRPQAAHQPADRERAPAHPDPGGPAAPSPHQAVDVLRRDEKSIAAVSGPFNRHGEESHVTHERRPSTSTCPARAPAAAFSLWVAERALIFLSGHSARRGGAAWWATGRRADHRRWRGGGARRGHVCSAPWPRRRRPRPRAAHREAPGPCNSAPSFTEQHLVPTVPRSCSSSSTARRRPAAPSAWPRSRSGRASRSSSSPSCAPERGLRHAQVARHDLGDRAPAAHPYGRPDRQTRARFRRNAVELRQRARGAGLPGSPQAANSSTSLGVDLRACSFLRLRPALAR